MDKLSEKIVSTLKSNTYNSVYLNTLAKLPIIITNEGTFINNIEVSGDVYPVIDGKPYLGELHIHEHETKQLENYNPENIVYLSSAKLTEKLSRKCRLINVKKFHYDDTWYGYRYSVDKPEETFGILQVGNLPFRSLDKLLNKKSFICRMDQLMFTGIMQPFMLFINGKIVNWNDIDIVFDCDESYLLLHGDKYNYHNLKAAEKDGKMHMVILPFDAVFIGEESDDVWRKNYEMLKNFIQDSLRVVDNEIIIDVPTMYSIYKKRGMVYNVGAWVYTQLYMNHLGLLSDERVKALKDIEINKIDYDKSGNIIESKRTRFNALDRDSYDIKTYNDICTHTIEYFNNRIMFKFDNDGKFDNNGKNLIINLDDSMRFDIKAYSDKNIIINYSEYKETLFRENFIMFKDGLLFPDCEIEEYGNNIFTINNNDEKNITVAMFNPSMIEETIEHSDIFNRDNFNTFIMDYINNPTQDKEKLLTLATEQLNYSYMDNASYEDNYNMGFNSIMSFNPLLFNNLMQTTIKSSVIYGSKANEHIKNYKGLKIPRSKCSDHETYVIVFINGEIIENYNEMYVTSNYFFLPRTEEFATGDVIEFLYFTDCDNNEIHFNITDNMISKLKDSTEVEFVESELFKEYIKSEDIKIFAEYPEEILIYKDLIKKNKDIAFNISYRNTDKKLLLFKEVINNKSNDLIAVSSRKFIYERLYVDQKAYRIKLSERFRYCDNQKQYMLFINGRRMEDDSFLITIPKYSRPFWGMYLYTARFVGPDDRVELFYVPEELSNINTDDISPTTISTNGYIETDKNNLDTPCNGNSYLYFVNGKKIPSIDIIPIDSHSIKLNSDIRTVSGLKINKAYRSISDSVKSYMKSNTLSKYDNLIKYIKENPNLGYDKLNYLFNTYSSINTNEGYVEEDKLKINVKKYAIITEIIRDFWVTSGFDYSGEKFIYDFELDEFVIIDGNKYTLPTLALDASIINEDDYVNIKKNNIWLSEFDTNKGTNIFEIGSAINDLEFNWDFSGIIDGSTGITSQYVNDEEIASTDRSYKYGMIDSNTSFHFKFNTLRSMIEKQVDIKFCNGVYYGLIDEDLLEGYRNGIIAYKINKNGIIDSNNPIKKISIKSDSLNMALDPNTIYDEYGNIKQSENDVLSLNDIMKELNVHAYQDSIDFNLDKYKMGNNKHFIFACPKRLAYKDGNLNLKFLMPDLNDPDFINYGKDQYTIPVYTDGTFDNQNNFTKLDEFTMEWIGEVNYTNGSGYTETYVVWMSNGYFTRKYGDYGFNVSIKSIENYMETAEVEPIPNTNISSFRIVNTASPTGSSINDEIVFIDTLLL